MCHQLIAGGLFQVGKAPEEFQAATDLKQQALGRHQTDAGSELKGPLSKMLKPLEFFVFIPLKTDDMIADDIGCAHAAALYDADILGRLIHEADSLPGHYNDGVAVLATKDLDRQQWKIQAEPQFFTGTHV